MDWLISFGLHLEGVPPEVIAKLDTIRPDLDHLALVLRAEMPRVNRIAPVLAEVVHAVLTHQESVAAQPAIPAYNKQGAVVPSKRKFF
jgi:hypothetical protein